MKQTAINPHTWSGGLGFDQAQLVGGHHSGQDAVAADGNARGHGAVLNSDERRARAWRWRSRAEGEPHERRRMPARGLTV
jgi:hypothetical protein